MMNQSELQRGELRVVTITLTEYDHSVKIEGRNGLRAVYKTREVQVCGDCIDQCDDDCKNQDREWGTCGCPHCDECDCDDCSEYIGADRHNAKRHAVEQQTAIDVYCPACDLGGTLPPDVEMRRAGANPLFFELSEATHEPN